MAYGMLVISKDMMEDSRPELIQVINSFLERAIPDTLSLKRGPCGEYEFCLDHPDFVDAVAEKQSEMHQPLDTPLPHYMLHFTRKYDGYNHADILTKLSMWHEGRIRTVKVYYDPS